MCRGPPGPRLSPNAGACVHCRSLQSPEKRHSRKRAYGRAQLPIQSAGREARGTWRLGSGQSALLAVALLSVLSCAKKPAVSGTERIAVLRFENLGSDPSTSWMGRAFSEVIAAELQALPSTRLHAYDRLLGVRPVSAPGISTESTEALLAGATR